MTYRNHILLGLAQFAPHCMSCEARNAGNVVAAHSNQARDGKGAAIKASDAMIAFMCDECHHKVDAGRTCREDATAMWEAAHRATMRWLIESGHLVALVHPQPPPEPPERPKAKVGGKGRKIPPRPFDTAPTPRAIPSQKFQKGRKL